jgi:hypothetical protein
METIQFSKFVSRVTAQNLKLIGNISPVRFKSSNTISANYNILISVI